MYVPKDLTILHIFSGDLWAGAEVMIFHLLKNLHTVPNVNILALSLNAGVLTQKLQSLGIETHIIPESHTHFLNIIRGAHKLLDKRRIDIIHAHRYKENALACILARTKKVRGLLTTVHGISETPGLKPLFDYTLLKRFRAHVVAVSREMQHLLMQKYGFPPTHLHVIHNGVPLPPHPLPLPALPRKHFHIGTIGRLASVKDFPLFLRIAAELRSHTHNVHFSILGDGPLRAELLAMATHLQLAGCVDFLAPRPNPLPYHQSLDLFLNTSLHEGIPMSVLEAMACGTPVIAPHVGGLPEIITHGADGMLVADRQPEHFAQHCLSLIQNDTLRTMMRQNAAKKVRDYFSDTAMAQAYLDLYCALAETPRLHAEGTV